MSEGTVEFRLLGPLEVCVDGQVVALGGAQPRRLLAVLLIEANRVVSVDRLLDAVWGESPPASAPHALSVYVSALRKSLGAEVLLRAEAGYLVRAEDAHLDARRFESLLSKGRRQLAQARAGRASETLRAALELWRGTALEGLNGAAVEAEAERLEELRLVAVEARIDADLLLGPQVELVPELEKLAARHPLRERFRSQLMLALYRRGRQAEALEVYRSTRTLLLEQLGLEPGPELRDLELRILRHDPSLAAGRASHTGYLPAPVTSFVDRTVELADLCQLLAMDDVRLVTLTGTGGIGKTRLALAAAATLTDDYPDGVWFVDLSALRDPSLLLDTTARVLGAKVELEAHLGEKRLLLLLDNFEQILEAGVAVADLLKACPNLEILVTSRERLRLSGEHLYDVPPLREAEAIALFSARAQAVARGFQPDADAVAVCRRLDGLPLAIELAAAKLADFTVAQLLDALDRRLPVLSEGPRDTSARQRTLRATIEWSHELLGKDERRLFARLSVFSGGCTEEAAAVICDASADALQALVEKNLLREESGRFAMLETVREYGAEKLRDRGEEEPLSRSHASYFVQLAEGCQPALTGPGQIEWLDRLHVEQDNVRAALSWAERAGNEEIMLRLCSAMYLAWSRRDLIAEGRGWFARALAVGKRRSKVRADALWGYGMLAEISDDFGLTRELMEESLAISRELSDRRGIANALVGLGDAMAPHGDPEQAVAAWREALDLVRELDDKVRERHLLHRWGEFERDRGQETQALALLEQSLEISRTLGDVFFVAATTHSLADAALDRGDLVAAQTLYKESLTLTRQLGNRRLAALCIAGLAAVASRLGRVDRSIDLWNVVEAYENESGLRLIGFERARYERALGDVIGATREDAPLDFESAVELALATA